VNFHNLYVMAWLLTAFILVPLVWAGVAVPTFVIDADVVVIAVFFVVGIVQAVIKVLLRIEP
jgi:hypothetical protein